MSLKKNIKTVNTLFSLMNGIKKWKKYFSNQTILKNKTLKLKYDCFYDVNNAFGKLDKVLQICDFLDKLSKSKQSQDTEKIRITILVSCAEAVHRINKSREALGENLVKGFFKPVSSKIDYKIKGYAGDNIPHTKVFDAIEVLYLIRNDYIHNGKFTGIFFRRNNSGDCIYNLGTFYYSEKKNKAHLIQAFSECKLSYDEFLEIFLEAFIKNINMYCDKN
jgi:hypothetical protein